jgi:putative hydrolase of the HAD superfamily
MIKAVVFDLDDTLISEKEYMIGGFEAVANEVSRDFRIDGREIFLTIKRLSEESSKNVFNRLLDFYALEYDESYILQLVKTYREHDINIKFYKDVMPVLYVLKGRNIKLGIITDGYKEAQNKKIQSLNCSEIFDSIIITDELGREYWKPHRLSYERTALKLGVSYKEMIYVGDNISKDFIGANKLGIKTIQIIRENRIYGSNVLKGEYEASIKIFSMTDLLEYLY